MREAMTDANKKQFKVEVNYRLSLGPRDCGNCSMFKPPTSPWAMGFGTCSLVGGSIHWAALCDRWEAKPDAKVV